MPGIRVDRLLASTAIALLLALPTTASFAGSENSTDTGAAPRQESQPDSAIRPAASEPTQKASNDEPATGAKPQETAAPANNSAEQPADEAKPAASADTAQPGEPAKSTTEGKPAEINPAQTKPAEIKPAEGSASDTAATSAPATATPEAAPPAAAAAPVAAGPDAAIAEQLRELGNGKFDRIVGSKKDRTQIETFYSNRNYAPLWITDGKANARATSAIAYLRHVDADGLDPADYPLPNFKASSAPPDLADTEIILTEAVITYAHHAGVGRVHWSRVSADIEYAIPAAEPGDVLAALASASDIAATLDSYEPQTPGYRALKA